LQSFHGVLYLFLDEIERIQSRHRNGPAFLPAWLPAVSWWSLRDEQSVVISAPSLEEILSAMIWRKAFACKQQTNSRDRSIDGLKKILQRFWEEKKSVRAEEEVEEEEEVRLLRDLTRHSFVLLERKKERKALRR
jgi:hypothetical protein